MRWPIPFSDDTEITIPSGPHHYSLERWIGSTAGGLTPQQAFESLSRHATPFQSKQASTERLSRFLFLAASVNTSIPIVSLS
jgi:hypothetical protein